MGTETGNKPKPKRAVCGWGYEEVICGPKTRTKKQPTNRQNEESRNFWRSSG